MAGRPSTSPSILSDFPSQTTALSSGKFPTQSSRYLPRSSISSTSHIYYESSFIYQLLFDPEKLWPHHIDLLTSTYSSHQRLVTQNASRASPFWQPWTCIPSITEGSASPPCHLLNVRQSFPTCPSWLATTTSELLATRPPRV